MRTSAGCWACDQDIWKPEVDSPINVPLCIVHQQALAPWRTCTCCQDLRGENVERTVQVRLNHPGVVI